PTDSERVLDWVIFNYLIHNTDSHLKNISMIGTGSGFKLAPFYDITSVGFYQNNGTYLYDNQFAFDIGGMSKIDAICDIQWKKLAEHIGLGQDYFLVKIRDMSYEILKSLKIVQDTLMTELLESKNKTAAQKVIRFISSSVVEKVNRSLINTEFKTKKTH